MKNWVRGNEQTAARVDPTLAAIVTAVVDLAVTLNVHTALGLSPGQLLQALLHIAVIATLARSVQLNVRRKKAPDQEAA